MADSGKELFHAGFVGNVGPRHLHTGQFRGHSSQPFLVDVAHEHGGARVVKNLGHFQAEPVGAGRDEHFLAGEIHFLKHALVS
ncbi:hypothetical protein D3C85_1805130 [compost metagenome]